MGHTVAEARAWKEEFNLTYPVLADPSGTVWNKFGMGYIPHNSVIDDTMKCQYTNYGFYENTIRTTITTHNEPLVKIIHDYLPNTEDTVYDYEVSAEIYSGGNLIPSSINVYYNTDGSGSYTSLPMSNTSGDFYGASIPAQPSGTTVYYYIGAQADNGKASTLPLLAPGEPAMFNVVVDTEAPEIVHTPIEQWVAEFWPAQVSAEITDILGIQSATLEFNINGGSTNQVAMVNTAGDTYAASFTGTVAQDDVVNYRIVAVDDANAQNTGMMPASGWYSINISALVDALVLDLDGNTNSGTVLYNDLMDLGIETHYMTEMPPLPELYETIWVCLGVAPDNYILSGDEDTALFNYLENGNKIYLEGGNFWKDDPRVELYFMFGVGTTGSGEGDAATLNGEPGSIADGMSFVYNGDNNNIDRLKIKSGGVGVLRNVNPDYLAVISKSDANYKTIASSIEYGGLSNGPQMELLTAYAEFFGLNPSGNPTPTPTPDPNPCTELGVTITMPGHDFGAGDMVNTLVKACNPTNDTYNDVPLFAILDVYGEMFFYPSFNSFDYETITLVPGESNFVILPDFPWPSGVTAAGGILWYAGMTNPEMTELFGNFDSWQFGWH